MYKVGFSSEGRRTLETIRGKFAEHSEGSRVTMGSFLISIAMAFDSVQLRAKLEGGKVLYQDRNGKIEEIKFRW